MSNTRNFDRALKSLARWFERQKRVLPWRDNPSPYRVWVSEIMLQQTQVATVIPYFENFLSKFPNLKALAAASEEEVMLAWAGLGYYSRARNLRKGAQLILAASPTGKKFPTSREAWLEIPGVGNYTAGAILSIAFNQPEAILDGNVERVLSRIQMVGRTRGDRAFKERLWRLSALTVNRGHELRIDPSNLNQAWMELGATICSPRKPKCEQCPFQSICKAFRLGIQEEYPPRKKPKVWLKIEEKMHLVMDPSGRILLRKRNPGEWRAGLWDFVEELDPSLLVTLLGTVQTQHVVTRHKITRITQVWQVRQGFKPNQKVLRASENLDLNMRWIELNSPDVPVGSAVLKTWDEVRKRFELP